MGKSGSGKSTCVKYLVNTLENVHEVIKCTTRPPRNYEEDGRNYHFLSIPEFTEKVVDSSLIEVTSFRDWFYGTAIEDLDKDKINIGVLDPDGYEIMKDDPRINLFPVYLYVPDKELLIRSLKREKDPDYEEIFRCFLADKKDFEDFTLNFNGLIYNNYDGRASSDILTELDNFIK